MQVILIGKDRLSNIILPQNYIGNYWIKGDIGNGEEKLVNIEGKNEQWQVISNYYVKAISPESLEIENDEIRVVHTNNSIADQIILKEYNMYAIHIGNLKDVYILYCLPVYEDGFNQLNIKNTDQIFIGKSNKNNIIYNNKLVSQTHARIYYYKGKWNIENYDRKYGTFVNDEEVFNDIKVLSNGDRIFIMGLKIILMGDSLFVNNPLDNMKYNPKNLEFILPKKSNFVYNNNVYNENILADDVSKYFSRGPRVINHILPAKIKIDEPPTKQTDEQIPFFMVIGTSMAMSLTMIISAIKTIDRVCKWNS